MIQALKGAFRGIIGLLLNAPYKIDSMMEMSLIWIFFVFSFFLIIALHVE
jgi:hypothetical protein